jgi:DNA-binding response OmpR family regulator
MSHWSALLLDQTIRRSQAQVQSAHVMARTVLVVDDNPSVGQILRLFLERRGYDVLVTDDGPAGLALGARQRIDAALVDVHLPGMSGIEVCRILLENAATAGRLIPVWLLSGVPTPEMLQQAQVVGALAVIGKPFNRDELLSRIDAAFRPSATSVED